MVFLMMSSMLARVLAVMLCKKAWITACTLNSQNSPLQKPFDASIHFGCSKGAYSPSRLFEKESLEYLESWQRISFFHTPCNPTQRTSINKNFIPSAVPDVQMCSLNQSRTLWRSTGEPQLPSKWNQGRPAWSSQVKWRSSAHGDPADRVPRKG